MTERKKSSDSQNKKSIPASVRIGFVIFLALGFIITGALWMRLNDQRQKNEALEREVNAMGEQVAEKREELSAPFDADYIARIARRELGYGMPGEIFFRSDFDEE